MYMHVVLMFLIVLLFQWYIYVTILPVILVIYNFMVFANDQATAKI